MSDSTTHNALALSTQNRLRRDLDAVKSYEVTSRRLSQTALIIPCVLASIAVVILSSAALSGIASGIASALGASQGVERIIGMVVFLLAFASILYEVWNVWKLGMTVVKEWRVVKRESLQNQLDTAWHDVVSDLSTAVPHDQRLEVMEDPNTGWPQGWLDGMPLEVKELQSTLRIISPVTSKPINRAAEQYSTA